MAIPDNINEKIHTSIEITIRLAFVLLLIIWCFLLLTPFSSVVLWAAILAIAGNPVYQWLLKVTAHKKKWAGLFFIIIGLVIIVLPSWLFMESLISGVRELKSGLDAGTLHIPPPTDTVKTWPLIGDQAYTFWQEASVNLENFVLKYREQVRGIVQAIIDTILGIGSSIIGFVIATIIAGILLMTPGTGDFFEKFFRRLAGKSGSDIQQIVVKTINNVTKGVIGVALIQAFLVGIGILLAGVPNAGVWTLAVFILALLQLPATLVIIPVIIYLFSNETGLGPVLWSIYLILAGLSDNVLKPVLLGKGAPVPMLVIFLGVIGGFILSGFIGLFTGAIVLSIGYRLFINWLDEADLSKAKGGE